MELKLEKNQLFSHLQRAQNIVERKTTLPILSHVLMEGQASTLKLSITDLEVGITELVPSETIQEGSTTIHARKFYEILRELPEGTIHLKQKDEHLQIRSGRSQFRLRSLSPDEFPKIPTAEAEQSIRLPRNVVLDMLQRVSISTSTDEARYTLTGVLAQMESRDEHTVLRLVTTDGHRLSLCERVLPETDRLAELEQTGEGEERHIILPRKGAQEMRRLMEEDDSDLAFGIFQENAFVQRENFSMIMRLVQGKFPDYKAVFPVEFEREIVAEATQIEETLRRVSVLSTEKARGIRLSFRPGKLTFFSTSPEIGEAEEEMDVVYEGEPFEVAFNARYLLDFLQVAKGEVQLRFGKGLKPCVLQEKTDPDFRYVVMPLRI